jgi:hypothetical protein
MQDFTHPPGTDWLSQEDFEVMQYTATNICFLDSVSTASQDARNMPFDRADCRVFTFRVYRIMIITDS